MWTDALMLEQRIDRYELERSCFTRISLPSPSTLSALLLSFGINVLLLLALAFTTHKKPVSQQHSNPHSIKAVLVQPTTALRKAQSKPKSAPETNADVAHSVDIKEAKQGESKTNSSNDAGESEEPQKSLLKKPSAQFHAETKDVRPSIREATQDYINRLNGQRLHDIANQSSSNTTHSNAVKNTKLSKRYNTEDEELRESIEIVVDCNTAKGKIFSLLSENKGVTIEDRDFPSLSDSITVQGRVKCRDNSRFNDYINRRVNK
tara:strand:- start:283 stop:1071 length:789 start_codon:yes stop_codon:yes gene_type:complete